MKIVEIIDKYVPNDLKQEAYFDLITEKRIKIKEIPLPYRTDEIIKIAIENEDGILPFIEFIKMVIEGLAAISNYAYIRTITMLEYIEQGTNIIYIKNIIDHCIKDELPKLELYYEERNKNWWEEARYGDYIQGNNAEPIPNYMELEQKLQLQKLQLLNKILATDGFYAISLENDKHILMKVKQNLKTIENNI